MALCRFFHQLAHYGHIKHVVINHNDTKTMIGQSLSTFLAQGTSYFHISTPVVTGVDMDNLFAPGPLQRHIMLSAVAEEH